MYASLIGEGVDGVRLFTGETVRRASTPLAEGPDEVMGTRSRFGPGVLLVPGRRKQGPKADIGFGYVMNRMQMVGDDDPCTVSLPRAVHASLDGMNR